LLYDISPPAFPVGAIDSSSAANSMATDSRWAIRSDATSSEGCRMKGRRTQDAGRWAEELGARSRTLFDAWRENWICGFIAQNKIKSNSCFFGGGASPWLLATISLSSIVFRTSFALRLPFRPHPCLRLWSFCFVPSFFITFMCWCVPFSRPAFSSVYTLRKKL